jgi:general secretion pathway protein G
MSLGSDDKNIKERDNREAGFTLVELLVVLGILAMLATFAGPQVLKYLGKARTDSARIQIGAIVSALELYAVDLGSYPPPDSGLGALMKPPAGAARWSGPYLKKAEGLLDPWGRPYAYRIVEQTGQVTVFTLGRDNAVGGTGEDHDVSN